MGSKLCCTSRFKANYRRRKESKPYGHNRKLCSRAMVFIKTEGKVCRYVLLLHTFYYHFFVIPLDDQYLASRLSKINSSQSCLLKRLLANIHRKNNHVSKTFHFRKCFRNPSFTIPVSFLAGFLTLNLMYSC